MPEVVDDAIYRAALEYAGLGWLVLPLHPRAKNPYPAAWQKAATCDVEVVAEWWERWPEANVGVKFGKDSGIIDIEVDSEEQESALLALFGGEFPVTPTFKSGRGKHRLFRWRDDLPGAGDKGIVYVGGVGFRTGGGDKGAQSVFPPSIHPNGSRYAWIIHPAQADVAVIDDETIARIWNHEGGLFGAKPVNGAKPAEYWERILEGVDVGQRNQAAAELIGRMLADLKDPFDNSAAGRAWTLVRAWNFRNKPPIDEKELRTTFGSILRRDRENRASEDYGAALERYVEQPEADKSLGEPRPWRLVRVEAQPVEWHLYGPLWPDAPDGRIILPTDGLLSYRKIAIAAMEQARVWLGADFKTLWTGTRKEEGLGSKLTRLSEILEPEPEQRRDVVVADLALQILAGRKTGEEPDPRGIPTELPDGMIVFKVLTLVTRMQEVSQTVTFQEVVALQIRCGAISKSYRTTSGVTRFKVLSPTALESIRRIARIGNPDHE